MPQFDGEYITFRKPLIESPYRERLNEARQRHEGAIDNQISPGLLGEAFIGTYYGVRRLGIFVNAVAHGAVHLPEEQNSIVD